MTEAQQAIKELRDRGWTVAAISRSVGVADASVRRWVNGTRQPENTTAVLALLRSLVGRRPPRRPYVRSK